MALSSNNTSVQGLYQILAESSMAVDNFTNLMDQRPNLSKTLGQQVSELKQMEDQLLNHFGGRKELEKRLNDFKRDYHNFSGKTLQPDLLLPYEMEADQSKKELQQFFEECIIKPMQQQLRSRGLDKKLQFKDLYNFLNLQDMTMENWLLVVTEEGTNIKKRSGGQIGSKNASIREQSLEELFLHAASEPVQRAVRKYKEKWEAKHKRPFKVNLNMQSSIMTVTVGNVWGQLTQGLSKKAAMKDPYIIANLADINTKIRNAIANELGIINRSTYDLVIDHMLTKNNFLFFVGSNSNALTGLMGEICAMILFYDLTHQSPSVQWAAQNTTSGRQASADIMIKNIANQAYGIQVKNTTKDFDAMKKRGEGLDISFTDIKFSKLATLLGFDALPIQNLYSTLVYNVPYDWEREKSGGKKNHTRFFETATSDSDDFMNIKMDLEAARDRFEMSMYLLSAALLYMADTRETDVKFYTGDVGNVLYIVSMEVYYASDMLQKVLDNITNKLNQPIKFSAAYRDKQGSNIITDDINPNPAKFFLSGTSEYIRKTDSRQLYFTTSYTFK